MPDLAPVIGGYASAYIPNVDALIGLGWTSVRFYWATTETATPTLVSTQTLVAGTKDYSYNHTTANVTDWFEWCLYDGANESDRSERVAIAAIRVNRKQIRQGVGRRTGFMRHPSLTLTSASAATTYVFSALIDADASAYNWCNWLLRAVTGATQETKRVRNKAATGYAPSTGTLITNAFSTQLVAGVECELWRPRGEIDTSLLVEEAMQVARHRMRWEEAWYFTQESNVSSYVLPQTILGGAIRRVEYAADTYPSRPLWTPVGYWNVATVSGQPELEILANAFENELYTAGTVFRVAYNRIGDRMDNDSDYWAIPGEDGLEWAIAEVADQFLRSMGVPNGQEDFADVARTRVALAEELATLRRNHRVTPVVHEQVAR